MSPAAAGRRLLHHLGRRGAYLCVMGLGWAGYGADIILDPRYGTARGIGLLTHAAPIWVWGVGWTVAGTVALLCGLIRSPRLDNAGFLCICTPPAVWSMAYTFAWVSGAYQPVWGSAIAWTAELGGFLIVSGWTELPRDTLRAMRGIGGAHGG